MTDNILYIPYDGHREYFIEGFFEEGQLYKVQMRFGSQELWGDNDSSFAVWKQNQITNQTFSEWSGVMLVKKIEGNYNLTILNDLYPNDETVNTERTHYPTFKGSFKEPEKNNEPVEKYRFTVMDENDNELENSGWLSHNYTNNIDVYESKNYLEGKCKAIYSIQTKNGYEASSKEYLFEASDEIGIELKDFSLFAAEANVENGVIELKLSAEKPVTGSYLISRASAKTNFKKWEQIERIILLNEILNDSLVAIDATVESGVEYKYAIQQETNTSEGIQKTSYYYANSSAIVYLEYSYLYAEGRQLAIMFDHKINSFKHTVLASKQDTLGSKYPTIIRNGYAYYAEFPMSGTISMQMDKNKYFFDDSVELDFNSYSDENVALERKFREEVEAFLNNGKPKLFRSGTEGNIVVALMNVTLTPKQELNRMIYSFSATAYEIAENDYSTLVDLGIHVVEEFEDILDIKNLIIDGPYFIQAESGDNVITLLENKVAESLQFDEYQGRLSRIKNITIFPATGYDATTVSINGTNVIVNANGYLYNDEITVLQVIDGVANITAIIYYVLEARTIDWTHITKFYYNASQVSAIGDTPVDILKIIQEETLNNTVSIVEAEGWILNDGVYTKGTKTLTTDRMSKNISIFIVPTGQDNVLITLNNNKILVSPTGYEYNGEIIELIGNNILVDYKSKYICTIKGNGVA